MNLFSWVARTGENPSFVRNNAVIFPTLFVVLAWVAWSMPMHQSGVSFIGALALAILGATMVDDSLAKATGNTVAFWAHAGFAGCVVLIPMCWHPVVGLFVAIGFSVLASWKEFWFDLKYERTPPQTLMDSTRDWIGYATGTIAGFVVGCLIIRSIS